MKGRVGKRGSTVQGATIFYVTKTATVTEDLFLKILDNTKLDTHTLLYQLISSSHRPLPTQHTTNTTNEYHCHQLDSNLPLQKSTSCTLHLRLYDHRSAGVCWCDIKCFLIWSSEQRRREININVDIAHRYRDSKRNYRQESKNFRTNTVYSYQTEWHFISKANCA